MSELTAEVFDPRSRIAQKGQLARFLAQLDVKEHGPSYVAHVVRQLGDLLQDQDNSLEFGLRGGHVKLVQALYGCLAHEDDDAVDAADVLAASIATCTSSLPAGKGFPVPPGPDSLYPPPPHALEFSTFIDSPSSESRVTPWLTADSSGDGAASIKQGIKRALLGEDWGLLSRELAVLVRPVPTVVHRQKSQDDVGVALWPAAPVLVRWGLAHLELFAGNARVLEIGAGIGLTGTVLGLFSAVAQAASGADGTPSPWTLTDFNPVVLDNLRYNAALNDPRLNPLSMPLTHRLLTRAHATSNRDGAADAAVQPLFKVLKHDWSRLTRTALESKDTAVDDSADWGRCDVVSPASHTSRSSVSLSEAGRGDVNESTEACDSDGAISRDDNGSTLQRGEVFDLVLGSDMICCIDDAHGVAATLAQHLRRPGDSRRCPPARFLVHGGVAVILVPPPFARYGVDTLASALGQRGLVASASAIDPVFTTAVYCGGETSLTCGVIDKATGNSDASGIVVAGGREHELQLWVVHWPQGQ